MMLSFGWRLQQCTEQPALASGWPAVLTKLAANEVDSGGAWQIRGHFCCQNEKACELC